MKVLLTDHRILGCRDASLWTHGPITRRAGATNKFGEHALQFRRRDLLNDSQGGYHDDFRGDFGVSDNPTPRDTQERLHIPDATCIRQVALSNQEARA